MAVSADGDGVVCAASNLGDVAAAQAWQANRVPRQEAHVGALMVTMMEQKTA